jgi:hypothetical protein
MKKLFLAAVFGLSCASLSAQESIDIKLYKTPKAHHPTSIYYDETKIRLRDKNETLLGEWVRAKVVGDLLEDGKVVCTSCHVSNFNEPISANGARELRVVAANGSAICVGCHGY